MARLESTGLDELVNEMRRLGEAAGPVAQEMCDAAAEVIRESWRESAREYGYEAPGSTGRGTGEMIESIKYVVPFAGLLLRDIYPTGKDSDGVDNAEKAFILHYGRSNMKGTYWVDHAETRAGPEAIEKCKEIWDRFLKSRGG